MSYQWQKDGSNLNGQTNASLTLANVQLAHAGAYWVRVTNAAGAVTSDEALLTVFPIQVGPGAVDLSFGNILDWGNANAIVLQPDRRILVGGNFSDSLGRPRTITRLLESGCEDPSFEQRPMPGDVGEVNAVALQTNGATLLGGQIAANGQMLAGLVRITPSGDLDPGFAAPLHAYSHINAVAVQPDGRIVAAGLLSLDSNHWFNTVVRLQPSGALDTNFDVGTGVGLLDSSAIIRVEPLVDGRILVAGKFTEFSGRPCRGLVRLLPNGMLDSSFVPASQMPAGVYAVAIQPDGRILVAGPSDVLNPSENHSVARLNADGSLDASFEAIPIANERIHALGVQADGRILLGGGFTAITGVTRRGVARLQPNGSLDGSFDAGLGPEGDDGVVGAITVQPDGRILVGGSFTSFNGIPCQNLVRLNGDPSASSCRLSTVLCPRTGQPQVLLTGPIGARVVIEATSDLRSWTPLMTVTNTLGSLQVCDPAANGSPQRFYRGQSVQ